MTQSSPEYSKNDAQRMERHADFVHKIANRFLELHGVCVHSSTTGKIETPLNESLVTALLSPGVHSREEYFRLKDGVTEWAVDPQWTEFDPADPAAFWWYNNSYFRRHTRQPFSKDECHGMVKELECLVGDVSPFFENVKYLLLLTISVCDGEISISSPLISIRQTDRYKVVETVAYNDGYWFRAVYHRGEPGRNSHCVVSFTPFLLSDNKQPPIDSENVLSLRSQAGLERSF